VAIWLAVTLAALGAGAVPIPWNTAAAIVLARLGIATGAAWSEAAAAIVLDLRLPRVLLAAVVGAGLAGAGTVFQGLLRNPLADPYIAGVSGGAALGATVAITAGITGTIAGVAAAPLLAFAGAAAATMAVYLVARRGGDAPAEDLLLAGVAVSAFLAAVVSWLQLTGGESLQRVIFWVMGGFSGRGWPHLVMAAPYVAVGLGIAWLYSRDLNAFLLGDDTARTLGVNVRRARAVLVAAGSLMAAAAVSAAGLIGFVGLIVPHLLRMVVGSDHRRLLPAAALGGAALLVMADTAARTLAAPAELPVGILTAAIGAPFFLFVLARERRRYWS
jgi:iron complex transport system permease protein